MRGTHAHPSRSVIMGDPDKPGHDDDVRRSAIS